MENSHFTYSRNGFFSTGDVWNFHRFSTGRFGRKTGKGFPQFFFPHSTTAVENFEYGSKGCYFFFAEQESNQRSQHREGVNAALSTRHGFAHRASDTPFPMYPSRGALSRMPDKVLHFMTAFPARRREGSIREGAYLAESRKVRIISVLFMDITDKN